MVAVRWRTSILGDNTSLRQSIPAEIGLRAICCFPADERANAHSEEICSVHMSGVDLGRDVRRHGAHEGFGIGDVGECANLDKIGTGLDGLIHGRRAAIMREHRRRLNRRRGGQVLGGICVRRIG